MSYSYEDHIYFGFYTYLHAHYNMGTSGVKTAFNCFPKERETKMALTIEALAAAVIDLVLLRVMLRLENEPGADHPKERRWMLAAGVLLLMGCIAEIALRGAHIMQILLGIGFNLAFVAYFFSFRAAAQEA